MQIEDVMGRMITPGSTVVYKSTYRLQQAVVHSVYVWEGGRVVVNVRKPGKRYTVALHKLDNIAVVLPEAI